MNRRGRGRPRREYRIRVRAERREHPDYQKLGRALLEHAAIEDAARRARETDVQGPTGKPPAGTNES